MKTLLTSCLLFISFIAFAQTKEPFKKANTILIETNLTPEEAFTAWGKHLAQSGYSIAESNKDFLTITTGPKDTSKWNYDFVINSTVLDNGVIQLTIKRRQKSSVIANTRASEFFDWHYQGKNDVFHNDVKEVLTAFSFPVLYK